MSMDRKKGWEVEGFMRKIVMLVDIRINRRGMRMLDIKINIIREDFDHQYRTRVMRGSMRVKGIIRDVTKAAVERATL